MRFLAEPTDINFEGKRRGSAVMKWIEQDGYACAARWSGQDCVTVYVGAMRKGWVFTPVYALNETGVAR